VRRVLRKGDVLPLNWFERQVAEQIGSYRQRYHEQDGTDNADTHAVGLAQNIGGARAEIAVARALNLYPSAVEIEGDPGQDLLSARRRIDVKWNAPGPDLLVNERKRSKPCDLYLLVVGDPDLRFGGWAPKELVFRDEHLRRNLGGYRSPCYLVRARDLKTLLTDLDM